MESVSICLNCINRGKCSFSCNASEISFCEEYEIERGPERNFKYENESLEKAVLFPSTLADYGDYKGICMNCDEKKICSDERTKYGLMFCEDHR